MAARRNNGRSNGSDGESVIEAWLARHRKPVIYASAVVSLLFVAALLYAYRQGERAGTAEPPLVHAPTEPLRVKPDDPGGMTVPDRDKLVYNRVSGDGEEDTVRLRPGPELPVERPAMDTKTDAPADPEKVTVEAPAVKEPAPKVENPEPETPPAAKPAETAQPAAAPPKGFYVQLGALGSEDATAEAWKLLARRYPDLAKLSLSVSPLRRNDGVTLYRMRAGPLSDKDAADKLCATLKAGGQGCFPVAP